MNDGLFIWLAICTVLAIAFVIELFSDDESD